MVTILGRAGWGARAPRYRRSIPTPSKELWLHHSVSSGSDARSVRAIQDFHMDVRGWPDIAYTFLMDNDPERDWDIFEGVPPGFRGTHTAGHNVSGHAICVIGNFNHDELHPDTLDQLVWLIAHGHRQGWWPDQLTGGHRDTRGANPGDCPGDNLYAMIPEINRRVKEALMEGHDGNYRHLHEAHAPVEMPGWAEEPWREYVEAGGSSVPNSWKRLAYRFDIAWFWKNMIGPVWDAIEELRGQSGGGETVDPVARRKADEALARVEALRRHLHNS